MDKDYYKKLATKGCKTCHNQVIFRESLLTKVKEENKKEDEKKGFLAKLFAILGF